MKKLFFATLVVAMIGTSAFAADGSKANYKIPSNFDVMYIGAQNVKWSADKDLVKASFELNGEKVEAFYSLDGEAIGCTKKIEAKDLPSKGLSRIQNDYAGYQILETIVFVQDGDQKYYVSLTNGIKKQILEVSPEGGVKVFQKK